MTSQSAAWDLSRILAYLGYDQSPTPNPSTTTTTTTTATAGSTTRVPVVPWYYRWNALGLSYAYACNSAIIAYLAFRARQPHRYEIQAQSVFARPNDLAASQPSMQVVVVSYRSPSR
jgi:hypothetical protein